MNYYDARQLKDGSGWRYTCMNDGATWAVGSCPVHDPHATKDEAYACYTRYLLDTRLRLDGEYAASQHQCEAPSCGVWTTRFAQVDNAQSWSLCDEHRTRSMVETLFGTVGMAISSW